MTTHDRLAAFAADDRIVVTDCGEYNHCTGTVISAWVLEHSTVFRVHLDNRDEVLTFSDWQLACYCEDKRLAA